MRRWRASWVFRLVLLASALTSSGPARGEGHPTTDSPSSLADLSLEELGEIEVTSVSRRGEKLAEAAAAIFVITGDDVRRSGATSLPEVLRLAVNLHVARVDSSQHAISARGFNATTANKLQVMIDGRSLYTPLFSGVFWDAQDTLLEDVERIEVVSGPGGTLWGSNAVNGVINVITRRARESHGTYVSLAAGTEDRAAVAVRHGGRLTDAASYRAYAKFSDRDSTVLGTGASARDAWQFGQLGFRVDWEQGPHLVTVQGDGYDGSIGQPVGGDKSTQGGNLVGRWTRSLSDGASVQVQLSLDHTKRDYPNLFAERRNTLDLDVQHALAPRGRHEILWGAAYRVSDDEVGNSASLAFLPESRSLGLAGVFVQDTLALAPDRVALTLGAKLERNDYTGTEVQPNARLSWKVRERHLAWIAVSRAVRTPSRIDRDFFIPGAPPYDLAGGPQFRSETVLAYEAGWRHQARAFTVAVSGYYNVYDHLRTREPDAASGADVLANRMAGATYGIETWADIALTDTWRLKPGYALLEKDLRLEPGSQNPNGTSSEGNDPRHRFVIVSSWDVGRMIEVDATLRHVSALPFPPVPSYTALDLRLAFNPTERFELSLVGTNLLDSRHPEFGAEATRKELERAALVEATWRF